MRLADMYNAHRWRLYLDELSKYIKKEFTYEDYFCTISDLCQRLRNNGYGTIFPWPKEVNNWRVKVGEVDVNNYLNICCKVIDFYGQHEEFLENEGRSGRIYNHEDRKKIENMFKKRTRNLVGLISINDCPKSHREKMSMIARKYIHRNAMITWQTCEELRPWIKEVERRAII